MTGKNALMKPLFSYVNISKLDCLESDEQKAKMEKLLYASTCGSLMYEMIATHPDIARNIGR